MKFLKFILVFGLVFIFIGCATSTKFNFDESVDFSKMKTFDWAPVSADPYITKAAIDITKNEINSILSTKGFKIKTDNPDFLISASFGKKQKLRTSDLGSRLTPQQIERVSYSEGSIILIFLDGKTKAKIWWGGARADLGNNMNLQKKEKRVKKAIKELLENFPPILEQ